MAAAHLPAASLRVFPNTLNALAPEFTEQYQTGGSSGHGPGNTRKDELCMALASSSGFDDLQHLVARPGGLAPDARQFGVREVLALAGAAQRRLADAEQRA